MKTNVIVMPMTIALFERGEHSMELAWNNASMKIIAADKLPDTYKFRPVMPVIMELLHRGWVERERRIHTYD